VTGGRVSASKPADTQPGRSSIDEGPESAHRRQSRRGKDGLLSTPERTNGSGLSPRKRPPYLVNALSGFKGACEGIRDQCSKKVMPWRPLSRRLSGTCRRLPIKTFTALLKCNRNACAGLR
jgi:hypothetical protein